VLVEVRMGGMGGLFVEMRQLVFAGVACWWLVDARERWLVFRSCTTFSHSIINFAQFPMSAGLKNENENK
jgi:hypothetical protein